MEEVAVVMVIMVTAETEAQVSQEEQVVGLSISIPTHSQTMAQFGQMGQLDQTAVRQPTVLPGQPVPPAAEAVGAAEVPAEAGVQADLCGYLLMQPPSVVRVQSLPVAVQLVLPGRVEMVEVVLRLTPVMAAAVAAAVLPIVPEAPADVQIALTPPRMRLVPGLWVQLAVTAGSNVTIRMGLAALSAVLFRHLQVTLK